MVLIYLITINALGFLLMLIDKQKAKKNAWRIPERVLMAVAAVVFTLLAVLECRYEPARLLAPLGNSMFLLSMLYLALLSSIVAFLMINFASNTLPVAKTTAFCNLTTAISMFAGVAFLHEPFNAAMLLAAAMIILGVWKVQTAQTRSK